MLSIPIPEIPFKCVLVPELKDELVFSALSRLIVQRLKNDESFIIPLDLRKVWRIEFIAELRSFSPVERLITLDLTPSLGSVFQKRLLHNTMECLFSPDLLSLMESFLSIQIVDETKRDWSWSSGVGIPTVGLLTTVLLHIYFHDLDRQMESLFSKLGYRRYLNSAFLAAATTMGNFPLISSRRSESLA